MRFCRPCTPIVAGSTTAMSSTPIFAVHEGCSAVSPSRRTQSRISSSVATAGPGRGLAAVVRRHRRLVEDAPRDADRLDPLAAVLVGGQVVEPQCRLGLRVGRRDLHRAAGVGVHRPDVHLVAVAGRRGAAVVAHGDGQEVEHQVGVALVVVAAREAAALEVVGRARAAAQEQPLRADRQHVALLDVLLHRHRLRAGVLDVDLEVVLQVLPDAGQVGADVDAEPAQLVGVADAGQLQQLRGVDGAAAEDHRLGPRRVLPRRCWYSTPMARVPSNSTR